MEIETVIFDFYRTLYDPKSGKLYRGIKSLLNLLRKKHDLILITTKEPKRYSEIKNLNLKRFFKNTVICNQKTVALFLKYVSNPKLTLIVGDRQDSEIAIGKKLKASTLTVNPDIENPAITLKIFLENYGKI